MSEGERSPMIRVVVESPFAGDVERNMEYAKEAVLDCLRRGEAPTHPIYFSLKYWMI